MKKSTKTLSITIGLLILFGVTYATVTIARTTGVYKLPWNGTYGPNYTTAHHRGEQAEGDITRFSIDTPGVILDSRTGLYWQSSSSTDEQDICKTYDTESITLLDTGCRESTPVYGDDCNWCAAKAYCDNLVLGGYSDWRLANIGELISIIDYTNGSGTYWYDSFFTLIANRFWSSTTLADPTTYGRYLFLSSGNTYRSSKYNNYFALCVR